MRESRYFALGAESASERERLAHLESFRDPLTFDLLGRFGIGAGWQCLEVGAGSGSVVRWLAERAGSTGRVVATDIDTRFLEALDLPNVEVRRHDILADTLETDRYDLVHCRALLLHLPDPRRALECMSTAMRPDGWLVVEDVDYTSFGSATPEHPLADAFDRAARAGFGFMRSAGIMDPYHGRRVPGLLAGFGLANVGHEGVVNVWKGGGPEAAFYRQSIQRLRELPASQSVVSNEDFAACLRALDDPSFAFVGATMFAAWGRRLG